jgi:ABC-type transporter Mla subunit MlaD
VTSLFNVSIQRFFLLIIGLKIISSLVSLVLTDSLDLLFWIFAIIIPIALIGLYVYVGINRTDRTLTDEKFADTCYYMGFIFTITSIVISLFGLEEIENNFAQITFRFGAAMVSTLIGLIARVYLVSFKIDSNSAFDSAEDALIRGSQAFVAKLGAASDQYTKFESRVTASTNLVEEHVRSRIENLSEQYSEKLQTHFDTQQQELGKLINAAMEKMVEATVSMTSAVEPLKTRVTQATDELASHLSKFQENLGQKLLTIKFPDDYFSDRLAKPVSELSEELGKVTAQVGEVANEVKNSSVALGRAITSLNKKLETGESNLTAIEAVVQTSHEAVITSARNTQAIEKAEELMAEIIKVIEISAQQGTATETGLQGLKNELTSAAGSAKLIQEAMSQSLNLIRDAVERTSTHSQNLLNEIPSLKTSFANASTDLKQVATEISATTTAIKNLSSTYREDLANDDTNASTSASGKPNSF